MENHSTFIQLLHLFKIAKRGKSKRQTTLTFEYCLEAELSNLQVRLQARNWQPGAYRSFKIYDPKERLISAAPFADRVVHHFLISQIEPIFEKTFIHDSYANRKGKGTHKAIHRYQHFAKDFPFVLKCDIRKFFPSIDHEILKKELRWRLWNPTLLWLCDTIIDGSNEQESVLAYYPGDSLFTPFERRRGLPIGNLTSQFWANVYMNRFDHFVKETLRVKGYIRYVDDFVLFGETKEQLQQWKLDISTFLERLRLQLHPDKTQVFRTLDGVPFLGFTVFPYHRYVRKEKVRRYRRFLKTKIKHYLNGKIPADRLELAINAWLGHIRFGQSAQLEQQVFQILLKARINVVIHPNGSWKILETKPGSGLMDQ